VVELELAAASGLAAGVGFHAGERGQNSGARASQGAHDDDAWEEEEEKEEKEEEEDEEDDGEMDAAEDEDEKMDGDEDDEAGWEGAAAWGGGRAFPPRPVVLKAYSASTIDTVTHNRPKGLSEACH
jgi:hypothetical protein